MDPNGKLFWIIMLFIRHERDRLYITMRKVLDGDRGDSSD